MYRSTSTVLKYPGGQISVFLKNNQKKLWGMGEVRVEHGTYLHWQITACVSLVKNSNELHQRYPLIYHKNTLAFEMPLKSVGRAHAWSSHAEERPTTHCPATTARRRGDEPMQGAAATPRRRCASHHFCQFSWNAVLFHALSEGEVAIMHIQNEPKPNMTRQLWICTNWRIGHFSTSPLSPLLTEKSNSSLPFETVIFRSEV